MINYGMPHGQEITIDKQSKTIPEILRQLAEEMEREETYAVALSIDADIVDCTMPGDKAHNVMPSGMETWGFTFRRWTHN